jgi:hypothetical protein
MIPAHPSGLLTTAEAAKLIGVEPVTIRQWRYRGHLAVQGLDERGRPLHTAAAVQAAEELVREGGLNSASGADPRRLRGRGRPEGRARPEGAGTAGLAQSTRTI